MNPKCDADISLELRQSANACQSGRDDFAVGDAVRCLMRRIPRCT
jgi:hypothetical protein